jgi:hypothetical protein
MPPPSSPANEHRLPRAHRHGQKAASVPDRGLDQAKQTVVTSDCEEPATAGQRAKQHGGVARRQLAAGRLVVTERENLPSAVVAITQS